MEDIPAGTYYIAGVARGLETYVSPEFTIAEGQQIVQDIVWDLAPDDISLSGATVEENSPDGTVIGTLSGTDPDGDALTFTLTDDAGGRFGIINDNELAVAGGGLDYESDTSHDITVEASDGALTYSEVFTIGVANVLDGGEYDTLVSSFGQVGSGLPADFNADGRVDLVDFAILRDNFGGTLPAAPAAALQAAGEPISSAATPVAPVVGQPLDNRDMNYESIAATVFAPSIDLLMPSPSAIGHVSGLQPISVGLPATMQQLAATVEHDLRPLKDDPAMNEADDLLADILDESVLALPL